MTIEPYAFYIYCILLLLLKYCTVSRCFVVDVPTIDTSKVVFLQDIPGVTGVTDTTVEVAPNLVQPQVTTVPGPGHVSTGQGLARMYTADHTGTITLQKGDDEVRIKTCESNDLSFAR